MLSEETQKRRPWVVDRLQDVAKFFQVPYQTVVNWRRDHDHMPGQKGAWDLSAITAWRFERLTDSETGMNAGGTSPALELYRRERAKIVQYQRLQMESQLIAREHVHRGLAELAMILRSAGEQLQREYGRDAQDILDEALDDFAAKVDRIFPDVDSSEKTEELHLT